MAETVLTSEGPSNPPPLNPLSRIICHVCQKQFSQYTCPRCNSRYCSLPCYKSHSVRCTESFMRENVTDELRQVQSDDETKRKMLEILKRFHLEEDEEMDSLDEEDSTLFEDIIQKVLSGGEVSFDDLTLEERKRFQRAVASGELSKMIEPWEPWWLRPSARTISLSRDGTQLVQCVPQHSKEDADQETKISSEIPPGPDTPLPPLSKLSATSPSPFLPVHLVDIIYSYCFTLRIYNGDWQSDLLGSAMVLLSISSVLGYRGQPETVLEALSYCLEQTCSPTHKHMGGLKFGLNLVDDTASLLSLGSSALICLLSDLQRIIQAAMKELRSTKGRKSSGQDVKNKLKLAERKVYFIMCWVNEQPAEAWPALATIVRAEKSSVMEVGVAKGFSNVKQDARSRKGGVLIEEME